MMEAVRNDIKETKEEIAVAKRVGDTTSKDKVVDLPNWAPEKREYTSYSFSKLKHQQVVISCITLYVIV